MSVLFHGRTDYVKGSLSEESVHASPLMQLEAWLEEAREKGVPEPNAMTLATADEGGKPSARIVLLRGIDARGLRFFTNYGSRKAKELAKRSEGPSFASLLFFWPEVERQVRVEGTVTKLPKDESAAYFASRPRESQLGAWASRQSAVVASREELDRALAEMEARFSGKEVPLPEFWGGYVLAPERFEFWQGGKSRLHDRIAYEKEGGGTEFGRLRLFP
ncbi:MAG: pyridoxamine 5'-phosphate oxidase [Polyangiaceae bacterium]